MSNNLTIGPITAISQTRIDLLVDGGNPGYDVRLRAEGGSLTTAGQGILTIEYSNCRINTLLTVATLNATTENVTTSNVTTLNASKTYSPYINNTKTYNIKGRNYKLSGVYYKSYYVSPDKTTYTTSSFALPVDADCFSISLIYCYYTTASSNYQGMTKYGIMKYNGDFWFVNTDTSSTFGTLLCQPSMNVTNGYLNATFANASNDNETIYFVFKIETY